MPIYNYVTRDDNGKRIKGVLEAEDQAELRIRLHEMKLYLISAHEVRPQKQLVLSRKVSLKDLLTFTIYLHTTLSAGVPLLVALKQIADHSENLYLQRVTRKVSEEIQGGKSLSEAMSSYPRVFNELFVSVIRVGEASGKMDAVLADLIEFLDWQVKLRGEVKQATTYPLVMISMVCILVGVLIVFVFPPFMKMFLDMKLELPLPTRVVIMVSNGVRTYWLYGITLIITLILTYIISYRYEKGRLLIDRYKLRLPVFGVVMQKISISRFSHYLSLMLRSGIDISQSLTIVERLVGNAAIAQGVKSIRELIIGGVSLSKAMVKCSEFPPLVIQMISVGEISGKLEDNLNKVSRFYDREVPEAIKRTLAIIQPLVIVFMALVVLWIALSIFLPMFSIRSSITGR